MKMVIQKSYLSKKKYYNKYILIKYIYKIEFINFKNFIF